MSHFMAAQVHKLIPYTTHTSTNPIYYSHIFFYTHINTIFYFIIVIHLACVCSLTVWLCSLTVWLCKKWSKCQQIMLFTTTKRFLITTSVPLLPSFISYWIILSVNFPGLIKTLLIKCFNVAILSRVCDFINVVAFWS